MPFKSRPRHAARALLALLLIAPLSAVLPRCHAQQVQPVIMEYRNKAEGKFTLMNNTLEPMVVVLEPKSFSISPDGQGTFRSLDPTIHVQLSTTSVKLQPLQSYTIFYKADAESFPAWFTIYSTFSALRSTATLSVRIQLPHTVYLYQNKPIDEEDVHVLHAEYLPSSHKLVCEILNVGKSLTRVQEVRTTGVHTEPVTLAGFPLLPGSLRRVEVDWKGKEPPNSVNVVFDRFTLKPPVVVAAESSPPLPAAKEPPAVAESSGATPPLPTGRK